MLVSYTSQISNNIGKFIYQICTALKQNISFGQTTDNRDQGQNINGWWIQVTIVTANAQQEVMLPFSMNRIPVGLIVTLKDRACDVYVESSDLSAWTSTAIYIRGTVTGSNLTLFVI